MANDLVLVEWDGEQYSLFHNLHPILVLILTKFWEAFNHDQFVSHGNAQSMSGEDFVDGPLIVLLFD